MTAPEHPRVLSVIIPTFNYAGRIGEAVRSVLSQADPRCELLIIDDGSTDETPVVLAELLHDAPMAATAVRKPNGGPASARNAGLGMAKGDFLLFLDADDALLPEALARILDRLQARPDTDLLIAAHVNVYPDGREKRVAPTPVKGRPAKRIADYLIHKRISIGHGSVVFRRSLVARRPYAEALWQGEDIPVFAHMLARGNVDLLQHPVARINKHPDSLRHDATLARRTTPAEFTNIVFDALPAECQPLRRRYEAQRNLSLFRNCYRAGLGACAHQAYLKAFSLSPLQSMRWSYLSKFLRLRLRQGACP